MLENYIGKRVRVLVSTGSGAAISNGDLSAGSVFNPVITVFGILKSYDEKFIEIENSRMVYYTGVSETLSLAFLNNGGSTGPDVFENELTILNMSKVISVSLVREK